MSTRTPRWVPFVPFPKGPAAPNDRVDDRMDQKQSKSLVENHSSSTRIASRIRVHRNSSRTTTKSTASLGLSVKSSRTDVPPNKSPVNTRESNVTSPVSWETLPTQDKQKLAQLIHSLALSETHRKALESRLSSILQEKANCETAVEALQQEKGKLESENLSYSTKLQHVQSLLEARQSEVKKLQSMIETLELAMKKLTAVESSKENEATIGKGHSAAERLNNPSEKMKNDEPILDPRIDQIKDELEKLNQVLIPSLLSSIQNAAISHSEKTMNNATDAEKVSYDDKTPSNPGDIKVLNDISEKEPLSLLTTSTVMTTSENLDSSIKSDQDNNLEAEENINLEHILRRLLVEYSKRGRETWSKSQKQNLEGKHIPSSDIISSQDKLRRLLGLLGHNSDTENDNNTSADELTELDLKSILSTIASTHMTSNITANQNSPNSISHLSSLDQNAHNPDQDHSNKHGSKSPPKKVSNLGQESRLYKKTTTSRPQSPLRDPLIYNATRQESEKSHEPTLFAPSHISNKRSTEVQTDDNSYLNKLSSSMGENKSHNIMQDPPHISSFGLPCYGKNCVGLPTIPAIPIPVVQRKSTKKKKKSRRDEDKEPVIKKHQSIHPASILSSSPNRKMKSVSQSFVKFEDDVATHINQSLLNDSGIIIPKYETPSLSLVPSDSSFLFVRDNSMLHSLEDLISYVGNNQEQQTRMAYDERQDNQPLKRRQEHENHEDDDNVLFEVISSLNGV